MKEHDGFSATISFKKAGGRKIDDGEVRCQTNFALLKTYMDKVPFIDLKIRFVYVTNPNNLARLKPKIMELKQDLIILLEKHGYKSNLK